MAFSHSSLFFFSSLLICSSAFSTDDIELSPSSAQIKFWYENVQNKMPNQIIKKLSPLSKENCDLFRGLISKNDNFAADSNFCSLANLACTSELDFSKAHYGINLYQLPYHTAAGHHVITNDNQFSFFRLSILKVGNLVHLPQLEIPIPDRAFLPIQIASQVSLSSMNEITKIFPDSAFGATKKQIETTISLCNIADQNTTVEMHSCPKSIEEMINFSKFTFGGKKKLLALSSRSTKGSNKELMIKKIIKYNADKIVACHELFLPFATYYCHSLSLTNLYTVELVEPKTGAPVNTVLAICHMDTSTWSHNHLSFQILKFTPGQGEVCHWFNKIGLAWIGYDDGKSIA